ncbi:hypothetical protein RM69_02455, partial [Mesotoga sp. SC_NapDC3]
MELIDQLKSEYSEISYLQNAAALMVWDLRTYIPPKGAENRAEALGYVSTLAFKKAVSDEFGALLSQLNERATGSRNITGNLSMFSTVPLSNEKKS